MAIETGRRPTFLDSVNVLFHCTTWIGVLPFSIRAFTRNRQLQRSTICAVFVVLMTVSAVVQYHFSSMVFSMGDQKESGTLTVIIGYVIIYMEPVMLVFDVLGFLWHQQLFIRLVGHMQHVDDQLARQHVHVSYTTVRRVTIRLLIVVTVTELSIVTYNFVLFQTLNFESLWWFSTCIPLYTSSIAKIWFVALMMNVRLKFTAINRHMADTVQLYKLQRDRLQQKLGDAGIGGGKTSTTTTTTTDTDDAADEAAIARRHGIFMQQEYGGALMRTKHKAQQLATPIFTVHKQAAFNSRGIIQVQPVSRLPASFAGATAAAADADAPDSSQPSYDKQQLNRRLTSLCRLHDEICDIGKGINRLFSFQMLILMAYGFMSLTAKLYFVYCGMTSQNIPILFRSAESLPVSVLFIVYTGAKCVYVIYISWQTKLSAQKTGVMLHKVANVVDDNECYVVVRILWPVDSVSTNQLLYNNDYVLIRSIICR